MLLAPPNNHLKGQNILHVDVYDKDRIRDDRIGSIEINLEELYDTGHIDTWYDLPSKSGKSSNGEIHLILDYESLKL
ncbi:unnamed protein product [Adineta steineri]|uniref:C2 domain-containing protein n=1 Tax=Adineta steineri TaxID=433720 RepID=A0A819JUM6_9BILA|nr:unnamed protein product [Adineta steineri]CAF3939598.1 unnamed protein product [Adineta steineri]